MNSAVLVTGANGFVGRGVIDALSKSGFRVHAAVRRLGSTLSLVDCEMMDVGDIGPFTCWEDSLVGVDRVVHLAARVHVMNDTVSAPLAEFRKVNVAATERLARSAAAAGVKRFVFLSSIKVNGEWTDDSHSGSLSSGSAGIIKGEERGVRAFTEEDVPSPQDPYAVSKWEAELALHQIAKETGMEVVIIRPPLVYGPGVRANFLKLLRMVDRGIPLPLGAIRNLRSLVYLGNLVNAIMTCVRHPTAAGKTFLVSDGEDVSTPELIRMIASAMGKKSLLFNISPKLMLWLGEALGREATIHRLTSSLVVDSSDIRRELGWIPPYTLTQGLQETVEWYLRQRNNP